MTGFRFSASQRFANGDTIPHHWQILQKAFPEHIQGFEPQDSKGGTFSPGKTRFSSVSKFFVDQEGKYVFLKISDYAADSSAFNFWLHHRSLDGQKWQGNKGVVLIEEKQEALIQRSSAIKGSRYQIQLATNHRKGQELLKKVLGQMDWSSLN